MLAGTTCNNCDKQMTDSSRCMQVVLFCINRGRVYASQASALLKAPGCSRSLQHHEPTAVQQCLVGCTDLGEQYDLTCAINAAASASPAPHVGECDFWGIGVRVTCSTFTFASGLLYLVLVVLHTKG
jgi:hypothetical protein